MYFYTLCFVDKKLHLTFPRQGGEEELFFYKLYISTSLYYLS